MTRVFWIPIEAPGRLGILPAPRGGPSLVNEIAALRGEGVDTLISLLTPSEIDQLDLEHEAAFCRQVGIEPLEFPIRDTGGPPLDDDTAAFIDSLAERVCESRSVAIHCRLAIGRASTIAAATLVRLGMDPDVAFKVIGRARGREVPDSPHQRRWATEFHKQYGSDPRIPGPIVL